MSCIELTSSFVLPALSPQRTTSITKNVSHQLSSTSTDAATTCHDVPPPVPMTEGQILARNQGNLQMANKDKREATKQKYHVEIEDQSTIDNGNTIHTEFESSVDEHGFGSIVMDDGVARINNVLSKETANKMRKYVNNLLLDTTEAVEGGFFDHDSLFGNVYCKENRWDLLLPLEGSEQVMDCVTEVLGEGRPVATAIESVLGKDAELYELSTLISDPGSKSQPLHPDILYQDTVHPILTCFVALQDIDDDMGPTVFMPKSANKKYHQDLKNRHLDPEAKGLVANAYNVRATLDKGDCSLYSAMTLHCGSANISDKRRSLFYFSFRNNALLQDDGGRMSVSLRPELRERNLTLRSVQEIIKQRG